MRYRTNFTLTEDDAKAHVNLDLGRVIATAEVHLNGSKVGVRVAPPWRFDVTGLLKPGDNGLEVLVYSTLANHYQTIPSRYRGKPEAGLFGPVKLLSRATRRRFTRFTRASLPGRANSSTCSCIEP